MTRRERVMCGLQITCGAFNLASTYHHAAGNAPAAFLIGATASLLGLWYFGATRQWAWLVVTICYLIINTAALSRAAGA